MKEKGIALIGVIGIGTVIFLCGMGYLLITQTNIEKTSLATGSQRALNIAEASLQQVLWQIAHVPPQQLPTFFQPAAPIKIQPQGFNNDEFALVSFNYQDNDGDGFSEILEITSVGQTTIPLQKGSTTTTKRTIVAAIFRGPAGIALTEIDSPLYPPDVFDNSYFANNDPAGIGVLAGRNAPPDLVQVYGDLSADGGWSFFTQGNANTIRIEGNIKAQEHGQGNIEFRARGQNNRTGWAFDPWREPFNHIYTNHRLPYYQGVDPTGVKAGTEDLCTQKPDYAYVENYLLEAYKDWYNWKDPNHKYDLDKMSQYFFDRDDLQIPNLSPEKIKELVKEKKLPKDKLPEYYTLDKTLEKTLYYQSIPKSQYYAQYPNRKERIFPVDNSPNKKTSFLVEQSNAGDVHMPRLGLIGWDYYKDLALVGKTIFEHPLHSSKLASPTEEPSKYGEIRNKGITYEFTNITGGEVDAKGMPKFIDEDKDGILDEGESVVGGYIAQDLDKNGRLTVGDKIIVDKVLAKGIRGNKDNLYLEGTKDNPIIIHGIVAVRGDVIIKGYVTGTGTIYAKGNIYIPDDLIYLDSPKFENLRGAHYNKKKEGHCMLEENIAFGNLDTWDDCQDKNDKENYLGYNEGAWYPYITTDDLAEPFDPRQKKWQDLKNKKLEDWLEGNPQNNIERAKDKDLLGLVAFKNIIVGDFQVDQYCSIHRPRHYLSHEGSEDVGVDGIPGTKDRGEGDGKFQALGEDLNGNGILDKEDVSIFQDYFVKNKSINVIKQKYKLTDKTLELLEKYEKEIKNELFDFERDLFLDTGEDLDGDGEFRTHNYDKFDFIPAGSEIRTFPGGRDELTKFFYDYSYNLHHYIRNNTERKNRAEWESEFLGRLNYTDATPYYYSNQCIGGLVKLKAEEYHNLKKDKYFFEISHVMKFLTAPHKQWKNFDEFIFDRWGDGKDSEGLHIDGIEHIDGILYSNHFISGIGGRGLRVRGVWSTRNLSWRILAGAWSQAINQVEYFPVILYQDPRVSSKNPNQLIDLRADAGRVITTEAGGSALATTGGIWRYPLVYWKEI